MISGLPLYVIVASKGVKGLDNLLNRLVDGVQGEDPGLIRKLQYIGWLLEHVREMWCKTMHVLVNRILGSASDRFCSTVV